MTVALKREYKFFLSHLEDFSQKHLHEFVLIKGELVVDFFSSYEKALREGLKRFGKVKKEEEVHYFYHGIK